MRFFFSSSAIFSPSPLFAFFHALQRHPLMLCSLRISLVQPRRYELGIESIDAVSADAVSLSDLPPQKDADGNPL